MKLLLFNVFSVKPLFFLHKKYFKQNIIILSILILFSNCTTLSSQNISLSTSKAIKQQTEIITLHQNNYPSSFIASPQILLSRQISGNKNFFSTLIFKLLIVLGFLALVLLLFKYNIKRVEKQKRKLTELVKERTIHVEMQKEELKVQAENMMEVNLLLKEGREELLQQKEELQTQTENLLEVNILLREKQEEIQAQAEELTSTNNELSKLNATKDKFFSIIAHDLKNPLFAITSFTEMLSTDFKDLDDEKKLEFVDIIKDASKGATNLLDKLLQWARSQSNKIHVQATSFKIEELINEIKTLVKANLENKSIILKTQIEKGITAYADKNMINTVLRNIVNNAIKFTNPKGEITISAHLKDSNVEISIKDNGIGMKKETMKNIFRIDSYYSTTGTSGEKGTGLGIIICKEFVEKNRGVLSVESKVDIGSNFIFTLPNVK